MNKWKCLKIKMSFGDKFTQLACRIICFLFLVGFVVPLGYVLFSSFHSIDGWSLQGYFLLLKSSMVATGMKNSILLALVGTIYSLALEIPAAYVLSKKQYGWLTTLFFAMGQFGVALIPLYLLLKKIGLLNTLCGLILPTGLSVYYTQLLRARMINTSSELEDAAALDGCSALRYLFQICIPTLGPSIGVIAFFHASGYWSNTLLAKTILTDESKYPLTLVLNQILIQNQASFSAGGGVGSVSASVTQMAEFGLCVISALPMILLFLFLRRHIKVQETGGGLVM